VCVCVPLQCMLQTVWQLSEPVYSFHWSDLLGFRDHLGSPGQRAIKQVCVCVYINLLHAAQYFILSCINYTSLSPSHSNEESMALNTSSFAEDSLIRLTAFSSSSVQQQRISINYAHLTLTICTILTIANLTLNKNCSHFHIKSTLQQKQKQKTVYPFGRFQQGNWPNRLHPLVNTIIYTAVDNNSYTTRLRQLQGGSKK